MVQIIISWILIVAIALIFAKIALIFWDAYRLTKDNEKIGLTSKEACKIAIERFVAIIFMEIVILVILIVQTI